MPSFFEIPFSPRPERFTVTLSGTDYRLTVQYRKAGGAGWVLDVADAQDNPLVSGLPLTPQRSLTPAAEMNAFDTRTESRMPVSATDSNTMFWR